MPRPVGPTLPPSRRTELDLDEAAVEAERERRNALAEAAIAAEKNT